MMQPTDRGVARHRPARIGVAGDLDRAGAVLAEAGDRHNRTQGIIGHGRVSSNSERSIASPIVR
jgi:hypothetical protein